MDRQPFGVSQENISKVVSYFRVVNYFRVVRYFMVVSYYRIVNYHLSFKNYTYHL